MGSVRPILGRALPRQLVSLRELSVTASRLRDMRNSNSCNAAAVSENTVVFNSTAHSASPPLSSTLSSLPSILSNRWFCTPCSRTFHTTCTTTANRYKKAGDVEAASKAKRDARWQPTLTKKVTEDLSPEANMSPEELERWLAKRPVDDVWLQKHYPERDFPLDKIVEMNRQANHPSMLDNPDGDVMVELSLNMQGVKATKPLKAFSVLTHLPHKSEHSTCEPRDIAVLVNNVELQQQVEAKGARFVGGEELLLKLKNGLIQKDSDYDYLIAHMDMIQDLNTHLKRKHAYLMPKEADGTLGVNLHEMFDLHQNGYLLHVKSNLQDPNTGSVSFSLGKLSHNIPQMLENLDIIMRILRTKRPPNLTPKRGAFVTGAVVRCPPNAEVFKWEFEPLNVFMDAVGTESVF